MGHSRKSSQASLDLIDIADYISRDNPAAAYRFLDAAERAFDLLATFPLLGTATRFRDPRLDGVRLFPLREFNNFVIVYQPEDDGVFILRVVHGARDLDQLI